MRDALQTRKRSRIPFRRDRKREMSPFEDCEDQRDPSERENLGLQQQSECAQNYARVMAGGEKPYRADDECEHGRQSPTEHQPENEPPCGIQLRPDEELLGQIRARDLQGMAALLEDRGHLVFSERTAQRVFSILYLLAEIATQFGDEVVSLRLRQRAPDCFKISFEQIHGGYPLKFR